VWGDDPKLVDALLALAEQRLDTWTPEALLEAVDTAANPKEAALSVLRLGLGAPREFDSEVFERVERSSSHPDPRVRRTAIAATGYSAWPQFRPLLERVAAEDPDPQRRDDAEIMLQTFDQEGISGQ
jgi:hypothetical protein